MYVLALRGIALGISVYARLRAMTLGCRSVTISRPGKVTFKGKHTIFKEHPLEVFSVKNQISASQLIN